VTKIGHGASLKPAQQLLLSWFNPLVDAIEAEQQRIIDMLPGTDRRVYGPFLLQLPPPELACILMHETLGVILRDPIVGGGVRFARLALAIGSAVNAEVNMRRLRTNKNEWRTFKEESKRRQRPITSTAINMYARLRLTEGLWSTRVVVKVGAALLQQLLDVAVVKDHVSGRKGDPDSDKPVKAFTHEIISKPAIATAPSPPPALPG
jgi:DNA-directed RNA polymerase